jgi:large subunit ribosomal protein L13e
LYLRYFVTPRQEKKYWDKMVKHNNVLPNIHCHKKYCESSRGPLKVKLALNQASRKKARRLARAKKAAAIAPAPLQKLRPIVHCPTQKYSAKTRLGKGFTLEEVKAAGLNPKYARTVGISVDHRRTNKSNESLELNVGRLKTYLANLVILKKGQEAGAVSQLKGDIQPIDRSKPGLEMQNVTDELKSFNAFTTMRLARKENKIAGYRIAVENRKKKE